MKIEHFIREYQGEVLSKTTGKVVLRFDKKHFRDYKNEDFNAHFIVEVLMEFLLLEKLSMGQYSAAKNNYLYKKAVKQPPITITGQEVDDFTRLYDLNNQLKIYGNKPATPAEIAAVMKALEKYYPAAEIATTNADARAIERLIDAKKSTLWKSILDKVAPKVVRTYEWKRLSNGTFDLSLPATIFLNTVTFDEKEFKKLEDITKQILTKYDIAHQEDSLTIWAEFQNVQPKPKKAKVPPVDFENLQGKAISADDYFYGLTKAGWKYDLEESDLFYTLSKTFWAKGIKVCLVLSEHCCIPPDGEDTSIEAVDFFKFDKKRFKERTMREKYESGGYDFDTYEEFEAYFEEQYPFYSPHADLNTKDYELLQKLEVTDVPAAIIKEIWADLHSF